MKRVVHSNHSGFRNSENTRNASHITKFVIVLLCFVGFYMWVFKTLMEAELKATVSWVDCFYWVLTTMSTLGYGDITFKHEAGRIFSMAVMFTGVIYLFIVLPFFFMEFFRQTFCCWKWAFF